MLEKLKNKRKIVKNIAKTFSFDHVHDDLEMTSWGVCGGRSD